tara:strand:+ start:19204 stop:19404 length:201 start_codon:yes stop_codon:yes gene_type:complete
MDALRKWNYRLEKIWLVIASLASLLAIIVSLLDKFQNVEIYYLLAILAWGIYLVRRGLRKHLSKKK